MMTFYVDIYCKLLWIYLHRTIIQKLDTLLSLLRKNALFILLPQKLDTLVIIIDDLLEYYYYLIYMRWGSAT
jgi:hypothetical protein